MMLRLKNNSGIILIVVLWVTAILAIFVLSVSRRAKMDGILTQNHLAGLKAKYAAVAGILYARELIRQDNLDSETSKFDTKTQCGLTVPKDKTPEDILKNIPLDDAHFSIRYPSSAAEGPGLHYGMQDEESKLNINTVPANYFKVISQLIMQFDIDEETADTIAFSILDWRDGDQNLSDPAKGAEQEYYLSQHAGYECKDRLFESVKELSLVRGMTPELLQKAAPYLTVYPMGGRFLLNLNTASGPVLKAAARAFSGDATNTTLEDADSLVDKILSSRRGEDGQEATSDDRLVVIHEMNLTTKEQVLANLLATNATDVSKYINVQVEGRTKFSPLCSHVTAVISRDDLSVLSWERDSLCERE